MARQRSRRTPEDMAERPEMTGRVSPYAQLSDDDIDEYDDDFEDEGADDEYDEPDDDYEEDDQLYEEDEGHGGGFAALKGKLPSIRRGGASGGGDGEGPGGGLLAFLGTLPGRIAAAVIALLLVALIALGVVKLISMRGEDASSLPSDGQSGQGVTAVLTPQATSAAQDDGGAGTQTGGMIFGVSGEQTPEPDEAAAQTAQETPLPIILTNTPTPSPTPTLEPTPTPSPEPSPTPTPSPTARADIAVGKANRDANLRETATSNGKVKQTVKQGKAVTIHEALYDADGKIWYALTVDDEAVTGYMRDYVIDVDGAKPTPLPEREESDVQAGLAPVDGEDEATAGNGQTNRVANLRKAVGGAVVKQLPKGEALEILSKETDASGNLWYNVRTQDGTTGAMRDYVVTLSSGAVIEEAQDEATPAPQAQSDDSGESGAQTAAASSGTQSLLDREVIGKATTDRAANVREKPVSNAKVVRQLSEGVELHVLGRYADEDGKIWYEVVTTSGKTYGFVRDYVVWTSGVDKSGEPLTYTEP